MPAKATAMRFFQKFFLVGWLLLVPAWLGAASLPLLNQVKELTLPNGMKFLLLARKGAPVFSAIIQVKVGGVDEADQQTGIAHLLEHMAFKGTSTLGSKDYAQEKILLEQIELAFQAVTQATAVQKPALTAKLQQLLRQANALVEKEAFSQIYQRNGAYNLNATTGQDVTNYFVTLPSTKLELWAYLESNRLKDPVFREFYAEKEVVQEERRMRVEDSPFGKLYQAFLEIAFEQSPYRRPTIGYDKVIASLSASDLKAFYKKYYVPGNMVGAIVGDIDLKATEQILRQYFGALPSGPLPPRPMINEPEPIQEKNITVNYDAGSALIIAYLKPALPNPDDDAFTVLNNILCEGPSSRLYRRLVEQDRLALQLSCGSDIPGSRFENLFFIYITLAQGKNSAAVLQAIDEEFQKIKQTGVDAAELKKTQKTLLFETYAAMQSNSDLAELLSDYEILAGSWRHLLQYSSRIEAVTSSDLQRLVGRYLTTARRRVGLLQREGAGS